MSSPPPDATSLLRQLADELRRLRVAAGLSGEELGRRIGVSQSKVSKVENAHRRPTVADVKAWARITGAVDELAVRLAEHAEAVLTEATPWRTALREGLPRKQQQVAELEASAALICNFQPGAIPGLLQTPEYARRLFELSDTVGQQDYAQAVIERMNRQTALHDDKRFEFILTEAALRYCPGPPRVLLAQLDRVAAIVTLPNVNIGFIPWGIEARTIFSHGFVIYDECEGEEDPVVKVETLTAGLTVTEPEAVETYRRQFTRLREAATYDEDGMALLLTIMADVRSHQ